MRTKLLIALALVMAISALAGCGGASGDAARAAVPRIPRVPHPPPRPPVRIPHPPRPRVHIPPGEAARFEVLKQRRVHELEERYAQVSELIPYARQAKEICDMSQAESVEDAVDQVVLNVGGGATLGLRLLKLTEDLENQSSIDQIGHAAVFALCEAAG